MSDVQLETSQYEPFWNWFSENLDYIETIFESPHMVTGAVGKMLETVAPNANFEIGKNGQGNFEIILIAGGLAENIETIIGLYKAAPKMNNWIVTPFGPRQDMPLLEFNGLSFNITDYFYQCRADEGRPGLLICIKGYDPALENEYKSAAFMFMDCVLGEYDVMTKIGAIDFVDYPENAEEFGLKDFTYLAADIDAMYGVE